MNSDASIAVAGGGQAAMLVATELRRLGHQGDIVLLSDEAHVPYDRTTLSKKMLLGSVTMVKAAYRPAEAYEKLGIDVRLNDAVTEIDRERQKVRTAAGKALRYDKLVIATGCRAREISLPGSTPFEILTLRRADDLEHLRAVLMDAERLVVLGGGFLGLEVASSASVMGTSVTVLEAQHRLLGRSSSERFAAEVEKLHEKNGVAVRCGEIVNCIDATGRIQTSAASYDADVVLAAIGSLANDAIAAAAGLACNNGIVTDSDCRTSDDNIFAIGDCASRFDERLDRHLRSEAIYSATAQASHVASILTGTPTPPEKTPYFWSEQFGLRLQIAGSVLAASECEDIVARTASGYSVCRFQDGRLACVETINDPKRFIVGRGLIGKPRDEAAKSLELENG